MTADNDRAIVPAGAPATAPPARLPEIARALAQARKLCKPVPKTAWNSFLKVYYAPAEAIIETALSALKEVGLALIPMKSVVNGHSKDGADRLELENTFLLVHEATGEYMPVVRAWPISQEKGTTLLKATCATDTVSLAYYYRALLGIARVDAADDPMSTPPASAAPAPADSPHPSGSVVDAEVIPPPPATEPFVPLDELARFHRRTPDQVSSLLAAIGETNLSSVPEEKLPRARQLVIQGQARSVQVDRIMELREKLGIRVEDLQTRLREVYHVESLAHLTHPEAERIEEKLRAALTAKGAAT